MPEKYHIQSKPIPPRRPRIGHFGIVDWREDCARCHNCVKKACVYDRYRMEAEFIRGLRDFDTLFFECMGCFSCVQDCTKGLLSMSINPEYESMGNAYWTPDIIHTTWMQAETGRIPVSGAGYSGAFSGPGFDSMWTDMSEIVRPTRDGIHGREYISTSVDIGRKPAYLSFEGNSLVGEYPDNFSLPIPLVFDLSSEEYGLPKLNLIRTAAAARTGTIALVNPADYEADMEQYLPHISFSLSADSQLPAPDLLRQTKMIELAAGDATAKWVDCLKKDFPGLIICIRTLLDADGIERAVSLAQGGAEVIHVVADMQGNEIGADNPQFIKDMLLSIHTTLVERGVRDQVTLIASGGMALAEHMAKAIICGADLVGINLPLQVALECRLCGHCDAGGLCPTGLDEVDFDYGVGRMTNLIAAWYGQLIEVLGAMGIREVRRLRGETGRAMFVEEIEKETFGELFGTRR
jgi:ferredoxin